MRWLVPAPCPARAWLSLRRFAVRSCRRGAPWPWGVRSGLMRRLSPPCRLLPCAALRRSAPAVLALGAVPPCPPSRLSRQLAVRCRGGPAVPLPSRFRPGLPPVRPRLCPPRRFRSWCFSPRPRLAVRSCSPGLRLGAACRFSRSLVVSRLLCFQPLVLGRGCRFLVLALGLARFVGFPTRSGFSLNFSEECTRPALSGVSKLSERFL